jgi:hypothetical protein
MRRQVLDQRNLQACCLPFTEVNVGEKGKGDDEEGSKFSLACRSGFLHAQSGTDLVGQVLAL